MEQHHVPIPYSPKSLLSLINTCDTEEKQQYWRSYKYIFYQWEKKNTELGFKTHYDVIKGS